MSADFFETLKVLGNPLSNTLRKLKDNVIMIYFTTVSSFPAMPAFFHFLILIFFAPWDIISVMMK